MKTGYWIVVIILFVLVIGFVVAMIGNQSIGDYPRLGNIIQGVGVLIALIASIVAIGMSDKKKKQIKVEIKYYIITNTKSEYKKDELLGSITNDYMTFPDPIESYHVAFEVTNISEFSLKKPFVTFWLPKTLMHPEKRFSNDLKYTIRNFNSNIYNSQEEQKTLEFSDTRIISNSNFPYLNRGDKIPFWIRMVLSLTDTGKHLVTIAVNCENADGITKEIEIIPASLLKGS